MKKKPNIVVIQADQLSALWLPMYGNTIVKTPFMDAIAAQGMTFLNAYCNNPVCGPSRASMLTGQMSSEIGVYDNGADFASSIPTLAHYLRNQNYRTCLSGKMHFVGADQLHGFEERLTTDIYPSDFGWTADWSKQDEPYAPSRMSLRSVVEAGTCKRSLQIDYDEEVCYQTEQWIYDRARDTDERPFLLFASFTHPHNPFVTTEEFWSQYNDSQINLPAVPAMPYDKQDPWSQRYSLTIRTDEHKITDRDIRNARQAYYGMVSYFDSLVGRILKALEDCNYTDETYVFITADHGEMLGERGLWYKFNPFEASVRIPMLVAGPDVASGKTEERGVSLLDLLPTFLDLATDGNLSGVCDELHGKSLVKMLRGSDNERSDDVMIEYTGEGVYAPALIIRLDGWKYIYCRKDPPMLFNLASDPHELKNLAGTREASDIESRIKNIISQRWNYDDLEKRISISQQHRLLIQDSLLKGRWTGWDFQPFTDATRAYVRGAVDPNTTATKARKRFPFVPEVPPHYPRKKTNSD